METGSRVERTHGKAAAGGPSKVVDCGVGWTRLQLAGEAATGGLGDRPQSPGLQLREIKPQTSDSKRPWGLGRQQETPSLTGEVVGEIHRDLECAQAHRLGNQHQRGPL